MTKRWALLTVAAFGLAGLLTVAGLTGGCASNAGTPAAAGQSGGEKMVTVENDRCPIMASELLPTHQIPVSLTREYKGHEIGFCCSSCPVRWDKMTDAQKDAELAKIIKQQKKT